MRIEEKAPEGVICSTKWRSMSERGGYCVRRERARIGGGTGARSVRPSVITTSSLRRHDSVCMYQYLPFRGSAIITSWSIGDPLDTARLLCGCIKAKRYFEPVIGPGIASRRSEVRLACPHCRKEDRHKAERSSTAMAGPQTHVRVLPCLPC